MDDALQELGRRLRTADREELIELVERHLDDLDGRAVEQALRNVFVTSRIIETLLKRRRLLSSYQVRRSFAVHPRTPHLEALQLIQGLYWQDLLRVGRDTRVHPVVRRAASRRLATRLPALSLGEKLAIARSAGPALIGAVRHDRSAAVVKALLDNPYLTESLLAPVVFSETTPPEILATIGRDSRWTRRQVIRAALCRNRRTPSAIVLPLLPAIGKSELAIVAGDVRLAREVRRRAQLLLGLRPEAG